MEKLELKDRKDIPEKYKWDIESMYKTKEEWEKDLEYVLNKAEDFPKYKEKLDSSGEVLLEALNEQMDLYRKIANVYVYANMKLDEDTRVSSSQEMQDKALAAYVKIEEKTSFMTPEILSIDEAILNTFMEETEGLKLYDHYLKIY